MNTWGKHIPGSGSSKCKDPEVGVCLACSKTASRSVWLVSESRGRVGKSRGQRESHVSLTITRNLIQLLR